MTSIDDSLQGQGAAHVRHYPLDMDLHFERYEHRRLAAREILVHRIVSKFLSPGSVGLAQVYDTRRRKDNGLHNFGTVRRHDRIFARDLELLRKMLVTGSVTDCLYDPFVKPVRMALQPRLRTGGLAGLQPPNSIANLPGLEDAHLQVTVGEEILDLIRRHYFETDDPSTRLWLHAIQPLVPSSYNTLPSMPRANGTHAASAQQRKTLDGSNRSHDEKRWYLEDTEHLQSLQGNTRTSHSLQLYDGGALLPPLRQPLLQARAARMKYLTMKTEKGDCIALSLHEEQWGVIKDTIYPRPGVDAPRTVLHVPSWRSWQYKHLWFRDMRSTHPVDFASGRTGRGMDRDGIWSTGRWIKEEGDRGRMGRRGRRRASSEPPPDTFTSALLPWSLYHPREVLIFPKMSLATVDRRSRRRSLSRTRIAEMFDWDTVFTAQSARNRPSEQLQGLPRRQAVREPSPMYGRPACIHEAERRIENLRRWNAEDFEWCDANGLYDDILVSLQATTLPSKPCCHSTGPGSCANCTSTGHVTSKCRKPCGFCGAPSPGTLYPAGAWYAYPGRILTTFADDEKHPAGQHGNLHMASECPVARHSRCKCGPFPQYHVATKCPVLCSRKCGNSHPPGHFKHKNAMTCRARCCMCGTKGHSGQQCKFRKCRCGGAHLGQDCRWQVECRVNGCDKFLCGMHCTACGISRGDLQEGQSFSGGRCPGCMSETGGRPADDVNVDDNGGKQGDTSPNNRRSHLQEAAGKKGRRKNPRKRSEPGAKKEKEELPWYAPLQPRTRPIVTSKSGKKSTCKN